MELFKKRVIKSGVKDTISTNYLNDIEGDGTMVNSQVYGFSMRRKRAPTTSNIQPGTTVRSYTQYNELQSSRCQSNISLDSLLTQYKHNPKNRHPNILRKDQKTHPHNGNDNNKARTINDEVGNESSSDEDQHAQDNGSGNHETLRRNRGPRPAYSDANMQHSLGYLP